MVFDYVELVKFNVVQDYDYQNRHQLFRAYLWHCWGIQTHNKKVRHTIRGLVDYWQNYIDGKQPDRYNYSGIKNLVIFHLGERVHEDIMNYTRFYYQTYYLKKKGVFDIGSFHHLADGWSINNKLFWYEPEGEII